MGENADLSAGQGDKPVYDSYGRLELISAPRRTTEESVSDNWAGVAKAINERADELGLKQRELADRSQVSQAIIPEIQRHSSSADAANAPSGSRAASSNSAAGLALAS